MSIEQQIKNVKDDIHSEEQNPIPNSDKLSYLYSHLNRLKESMRSLNNKKLLGKGVTNLTHLT